MTDIFGATRAFWIEHDGFVGSYMRAVSGHPEEPANYRTTVCLAARHAGYENGCFERQALIVRWAGHPGWLEDPWAHDEVFVDAEAAFRSWRAARPLAGAS